MNPGLVVKLRPNGPWRIGPDSGARNRVDVIYHSDSLYSAVTSAMARLGWLEEWLDATARGSAPAVSFTSCFPYLGEIAFVVPPRTAWPPRAHSTKAANVRWKSARFVPLTVVQSILAGRRLEESQWSVDGASDCLVPAGSPGPFRAAVRWSAAVDRLTGASERHSTACLEFRAGAGLWAVVSFADEAAAAAWSDKVKTAFRVLADTGFGGERSRGWGRSEAPEFIDGMLPDLILPEEEVPIVEVAESAVIAASPVLPLEVTPEAVAELEAEVVAAESEGLAAEPEVAAVEPEVAAVGAEAPVAEPEVAARESEVAAVDAENPPVVEEPPVDPETPPAELPPAGEPEPPVEEPAVEPVAPAEEPPAEEPVPPAEEPPKEPEAATAIEPEPPAIEPETPLAVEPEAPAEAQSVAVETSPEEHPQPAPVVFAAHPHWLLSLFTPAPADTVDWARGNYTVLARGGRVDSPAGSGELKKQIQMVSEGSVVYAEAAPRGSAADVAPDGFAHPVFRAGFAVAIPLPEVR